VHSGRQTWHAFVRRGPTSCKTTRRVLGTFLGGGGVEHGGKNAPDANKYWTLADGWRCFSVAGGGSCIRGSRNYRTAREVIFSR
jgi:hypothetical protein